MFDWSCFSGYPIKQADVILLGFPLMMDMPTHVRRNDLTFYDAVSVCLAALEL
jgi:hypothetical protein